MRNTHHGNAKHSSLIIFAINSRTNGFPSLRSHEYISSQACGVEPIQNVINHTFLGSSRCRKTKLSLGNFLACQSKFIDYRQTVTFKMFTNDNHLASKPPYSGK